MDADEGIEALRLREAPLHMRPDEFRLLGHLLDEQIAAFLASLPERPVTPVCAFGSPNTNGGDRSLPEPVEHGTLRSPPKERRGICI